MHKKAMIKITVEYFGPAKTFTDENSRDIFSFSDATISLNDILIRIGEKYSLEFTNYIIEACGLVLNEDYLELDRNMELQQFGKTLQLNNDDELIIVPPVSSG